MNSFRLLFAVAGIGAVAVVPTTRAQTPAAAPAPALTTTASGLQYAITKPGTGPVAKAGQIVIAHYVGTLPDGKRFDNSRDRGEPFAFTLGQGRVIKGWDEGFALLHVGDHATLVVPPQLAYGGQQRGPIPANATLRFDVELIDVKDRMLSDVLQATLDNAGIDAARRQFVELKEASFDGLYVGEAQLNALGQARLRAGKNGEAITVFKWNAELFPGSTRVHESLGDGYARDGQRELAIRSYERSVAINPKNTKAAKALSGLKGP